MKKCFRRISGTILVLSVLMVACRKSASKEIRDDRIERLKSSKEFGIFEQAFSSRLQGLDYSAARYVSLNENLSSIHIPIKRNGNVVAAVIAFPKERPGAFELVYQDNSGALGGSGIIYQQTADKTLRRIFVENNRIVGSNILAEKSTTVSPFTGEYPLTVEEDCRFLCRLDRCYNAVKAQFPGDTACSLLDIFYGVCTAATTTTCLIKMARGEY